MSRLLFWIALFCLVVAAIRSKLRSAGTQGGGASARSTASTTSTASAGSSASSPVEQGETMACCHHCHLYFPASESVRDAGLDYCSPAHVRLPPV